MICKPSAYIYIFFQCNAHKFGVFQDFHVCFIVNHVLSESVTNSDPYKMLINPGLLFPFNREKLKCNKYICLFWLGRSVIL